MTARHAAPAPSAWPLPGADRPALAAAWPSSAAARTCVRACPAVASPARVGGRSISVGARLGIGGERGGVELGEVGPGDAELVERVPQHQPALRAAEQRPVPDPHAEVGGDARGGERLDLPRRQPRRHGAEHGLGRAVRVEHVARARHPGADGRGLVVVARDRDDRAREQRMASRADRLPGRHERRHQRRRGARPRQQLRVEGLLRQVQPAGAAGQRPLADLVGPEPPRHPLRDVEPPHGGPGSGDVRDEPAVLGQRVLVGRRLAGAAGEARGVDVADELLGLLAVAAVVPGDGGRQGRAVPVDEHPRLAHAGDAHTADRPARRPQRLPDGGEGALPQRQRVHLDAVRPGVPGRGRPPGPDRASRVGIHDGLRRRRADVHSEPGHR
jgi:hypothetical protein